MVRVFLKGGVWKNSEDEILKAAIQKYGKQQWARVASLLNRKTAKQAKARWHEWLDPSIRKTEWSRQEEEKLLHLAKLMPAQWKTIAPLVGRTATQCQEHYEQLLDQASGAASGGDADSDLRTNLRPGQIDSHPETKPARPDPVDMDEDEMEMLQEARARLANTVGKKAKRKQREKILAQAKRLADLQKRRELKQAGLISQAARKKAKKRKVRDIDLGVEIPFHKPAPAGFHDVTSEDAAAERIRNKRLKSIDYKKVNENQYRSRDREAAKAAKRDASRMRLLEQSNEKYQAMHDKEMEKEQELLSLRPRGRLELPAPVVTDEELQQFAKIRHQQQQEAAAGRSSLTGTGSTATQALLSDYSDRPLPTPMRTPAESSQKPSSKESIMRSAAQLRMLERGTTPLLGAQQQVEDGEGETDQEQTKGDSSSAAVAAASTPRLPDRAGLSQTPGSVVAPRDQLGLNRPPTELLQGGSTAGVDMDVASIGAGTFDTSKYSIRELARQERRAAKRVRRELEEALAALPAPQFEYELAAQADEDDNQVGMVETVLAEADRADVEAEEREQKRKEAEKSYQARNSVIKRKELPRPVKVVPSSILSFLSSSNANEEANALIQKEMLTLLQYDAHTFPVAPPTLAGKKSKKKKRKQAELMTELPAEVPLDILSEEALNTAKEIIETELATSLNEKMNAVSNLTRTGSYASSLQVLAAENGIASKDGGSSMVYNGNSGWSQSTKHSAPVENSVVASLQLEFETIQNSLAVMKEKNDKIEKKLSVMNRGYAMRGEKFRADILQSFGDLQNARIEEAVYRMLQYHETAGGENRINNLRDEIDFLRKKEASLQKQFAGLLVQKRRLEIMEKHQA